MKGAVTAVTEDYLVSIYRLQEREGVAKTNRLVKMLQVVPGTVTNTVERLEREGWIIHRPYKGVTLTEKGQKIALRVLRRHRLSERLLTDILKVEWHKAHELACKLEHAFTNDIAKKLEKTLKHPSTCPHGNPIPTKCGGILEEESEPLINLNQDEEGIIQKITEEESDLLRYFAIKGFKPGVSVKVVEKAPFNGPITVKVYENKHALSRKVATIINVKKNLDRKN